MEYILLFHVAFLLNFVWEVWHSQLYTTCRTMSLTTFVPFITFQSLKDALWITIAYAISPNEYVFVAGLLLFSALVELHAIKTKRWEYAPEMPKVFGIGLTPLIELAVTGLLAFLLLQTY
ncbi:MAG: hypothetical protein RLZZ283_261 [Candidatus Parcubacteria bacterium]